MTRNARIAFIVGAALMAAGTIGPWAQVSTRAVDAAPVTGFGHGAGILLVLVGLAVALLWVAEGAALLAAVFALLWMAFCAYALPGALTSSGGGVWLAEWAWGLEVSLAGALVVGVVLVMVAYARLWSLALSLAAARVARQA